MALSGKEFQEIQAALLDGYGDLFDLRQMVRFGLDESLDAIAGGRNVTEQVFNLVDWADSKGRVLDLVRSAYEYNQGNEALKRLHDAWIEPPASVTTGQLSIVTAQTAQVFLSYSHQDTDSMLLAAQKMDQQGVSVWTDEGLETGTPSWQAAIESALRNTECMVVLLSSDAKQSEWVEREISVAQRLGQRIFPVLIRGTHDEAVPFSLETVQYIDARYEYQSALENRLVPSVARYLGVTAGAVSGQQVAEGPPTLPLSSIEFDWITVPAGEFLMGSDKQKDSMAQGNELPQHTVYLPTYYIARVPVTNVQYKLFIDATGHRVPHHWQTGSIPDGEEKHPVFFVSWDDARTFCRWAGVRLPTEAEREKAARGMDGRIYPWGNEEPNERLFNFDSGDTAPVDSHPDGASPYGCLGMAGNVWEWTSSLYISYPYDVTDGRESLDTEGRRVLRGGSFSRYASYLRCAARGRLNPFEVLRFSGFRVCAAPSPLDDDAPDH